MNKKKTRRTEIRQNWQLYAMIALPLLYLLVFKFYPMLGAQIAFRNYKPVTGIWGSEWVGLKHFQRFFSNPQWISLVKNTLAISTYTLILSIPFPIILAIAFDYVRSRKFRKTVQMVHVFFKCFKKIDDTIIICHFIFSFYIITYLNFSFNSLIKRYIIILKFVHISK